MASGPHRRTIVIVEDSAAIAEVIRDALESERGYRAVVVPDGQRALEVIRNVQAVLVLLDVGLPGLSGPALYDALRQDPRTAAVPVLFVTANYDAPEFRRLEVAHFIPKPFNLEDLLTAVDALCGPDPGLSPPDAPPPGAPILDGRLHDPAEILRYLSSSE